MEVKGTTQEAKYGQLMDGTGTLVEVQGATLITILKEMFFDFVNIL